MTYFDSKVISNTPLTDEIYVLVAERHGADANAGQFFMLKAWDNELTLMRPISIFKACRPALFGCICSGRCGDALPSSRPATVQA